MFSLRSISLFALACTAITLAVPTVNVARDTPADAAKKVQGILTRRGEPHKSFPEIFDKERFQPAITSLG